MNKIALPLLAATIALAGCAGGPVIYSHEGASIGSRQAPIVFAGHSLGATEVPLLGIADQPIPNPPEYRHYRHHTAAATTGFPFVDINPGDAPSVDDAAAWHDMTPAQVPMVMVPTAEPQVTPPADESDATKAIGDAVTETGVLVWLGAFMLLGWFALAYFGRRACNAYALGAAALDRFREPQEPKGVSVATGAEPDEETGDPWLHSPMNAVAEHGVAWYDVSMVAGAMTGGRDEPVTAEALIELWERDMIDREVDTSLIEIVVIDPRSGDPIVGEIPDIEHVHLAQIPRKREPHHHLNAHERNHHRSAA